MTTSMRMTTTTIRARGLTFTADTAGPPHGECVLALHGFPNSRHSWRSLIGHLAAAGLHAVARYEHFDADGEPAADIGDIGLAWRPISYLYLKATYRFVDQPVERVSQFVIARGRHRGQQPV